MPRKTNSPAHVVPVLAALAAARVDPSTLHVDASTPGLAGVLVLLRGPSKHPTPTLLRNAFADAIQRAGAPTGYLATLPDVVTPRAALGRAHPLARDDDHRWVHAGTRDGHSRWIYCSSSITDDAVAIQGTGTCAEAHPDGTLTIDAGVPTHIAQRLRDAYDEARGLVDPSRVVALVTAHLVRHGGRQLTSDVYLLPETTPETCGVLAGLVDLGGWAEAVPVADPARIARLSTPVTRSIEEQIADVVAAAQAHVARAEDVARRALADEDPRLPARDGGQQSIACETIRAEIRAAREAAELWGRRLSLASLDVTAQLDALDTAADEADRKALAEVEARRERRRAEKAAERAGKAPDGADLADIDDEQAREERAEAATFARDHLVHVRIGDADKAGGAA